MEPTLFEDDVKYDLWLKMILVGSVAVLVVLGILFAVDAHSNDIFPDEPREDSRVGSIILFASSVFVVLVFRIVLPRKLYIYRDKIRIKMGVFFYSIPFANIESYKRSKGLPLGNFLISPTSLQNQIEIIRKTGFLRISISPNQMDRFLEVLNQAIGDWKKYQPE